MIIGIKRQADGSVAVRGESAGPEHAHFRNVIPAGEAYGGLSYAELIQYAWIETDDTGAIVGGGKIVPADPGQAAEIPDFLRAPRKAEP
jgi:hypothetical protein